ncbi:MAG TPA: SMP-30/gluconolactonase/LRE family protein, partial [Anaerolineales bacterium]|nr:SMP-30/gluconolactonase/LRE family protein [Anaerolineales bacterium]
EQEASGALYSLSTEGRVKKLLKEVRISNGIAWSPDHKTMYHIDTPTRDVKAYDYDIETGQIANPRVLIHFADTFGWPDGMTTDMKGNLWIASWGGARVSQWNAKGVLLEQFGVPALNVTSCVFGGPDMNELFITTARVGMDAAALTKYPQAGGIFRMQAEVEGMPTFEFGG